MEEIAVAVFPREDDHPKQSKIAEKYRKIRVSDLSSSTPFCGWQVVDMEEHPASATDIRHHLMNGGDAHRHLPAKLLDRIRHYGIFGVRHKETGG